MADNSAGLRIIDVSSPSSPVSIGYCNTPGWSYDVAVSGGYAFVADYEEGLRVIDVSSPSNPVEVGYLDTDGKARGVAVSGSYVYLADGDNGVRVIDVSIPSNPVETGFISLPYLSCKIAVSGSYAFVANYYSGMFVLDVSDPVNPEITGFIDTPGNAYDISVSDNTVFVADYHVGLHISEFLGTAIEDEYHETVQDGSVSLSTDCNPGKESLSLFFYTPWTSITELVIYDICGRVVSKPVDEAIPSGEHQVVVDGLSPGLYFAQLSSCEQIICSSFSVIEK